MDNAGVDISVIIPVLNEEAVLPALAERLQAALGKVSQAYEVLFVDDGSEDKGVAALEEIVARDPRFKAVSLSRNFGHQIAITAGLAHARGKAVVVMDADLQDPPELIPEFHELFRQGNDVVYAVRRSRRDSSVFKRASYWIFYRLMRFLSPMPIPLDAGDFCLMSARFVEVLNALPERTRFLRGLRVWVGFRQAYLYYDRDARSAGRAKYNMQSLMRLAFDGILTMSDRPLRLATLAGLAVSGASFLVGVWIFIWRIRTQSPIPGYASIAVGLFFLGGAQLLSAGILGEYISRIFQEVKGRPLFVVKRKIGRFD